jgi:hypothetical protein
MAFISNKQKQQELIYKDKAREYVMGEKGVRFNLNHPLIQIPGMANRK